MLIYCWLQTVYHDDLFHTISLHGLWIRYQKLAIWKRDASAAQWSSRMIRASGVFPATKW